MKNWRNEIEHIEKLLGRHEHHNWISIVNKIDGLLEKNIDDVEISVRYLYILHNILLEETYNDEEFSIISNKLLDLFNHTKDKFSNNVEYLFFIGKILYVAEWFFGLNDDFKPIEDRLAFHMQSKAFENQPHNKLFEWACLNSLNRNDKAYIISVEILYGDNKYLLWLKEKGYPGKYILESIEFCYNNGG